MIVDSNIAAGEAIRGNPAKGVCPRRVLNEQCLLTVYYLGFDGLEHRGQIVVHEDATTDIHDFFLLAQEMKFPIAKVVPLAHPDYLWDKHKTVLHDNLTYGFNYRKVHGTERLSDHARGLAIDVNPMQNPYIRFLSNKTVEWPPVQWDPKQPGTLTADNLLVKFMEGRGWKWGGHKSMTPEGYDVVDYMHFSKMV